jgi:hypothetical protein
VTIISELKGVFYPGQRPRTDVFSLFFVYYHFNLCLIIRLIKNYYIFYYNLVYY